MKYLNILIDFLEEDLTRMNECGYDLEELFVGSENLIKYLKEKTELLEEQYKISNKKLDKINHNIKYYEKGVEKEENMNNKWNDYSCLIDYLKEKIELYENHLKINNPTVFFNLY